MEPLEVTGLLVLDLIALKSIIHRETQAHWLLQRFFSLDPKQRHVFCLIPLPATP